MKKADLSSTTFVLLLALWFVINIIQSVFTNLTYDEAYYWMFSKRLDWGYFDHPPMVALFIKLGGLLFSQELGVRFISVVAQLISLVLIWKLIDEKQPTRNKVILFFGISASIVMFHSSSGAAALIGEHTASVRAARKAFVRRFMGFYSGDVAGSPPVARRPSLSQRFRTGLKACPARQR